MSSNPNEVHLKELKELYNTNFWPDSQESSVNVSIKMQIGDHTVDFPLMQVWASSTIHDLFVGYAGYLEHAPPPQAPPAEPVPEPTPPAPAQATNEPPLIDVGQVTYRGNEYLVEKTGEESYRVLRKTDRSEVNKASPTCKAIIKIFSNG